MKIEDLKNSVIAVYQSRLLKSNTRYYALDRVLDFVRNNGGIDCFQVNKDEFKRKYVNCTGHTGGSDSSAINELYTQYHYLKAKEDKI